MLSCKCNIIVVQENMAETKDDYAPFEDWFLGCHGVIRVRPQNMGGGWQALGHILEWDGWDRLWDEIDYSRTCIDAIKEAESRDDCVIINHAPTEDVAFSRCVDGLKAMHAASIESLISKTATKLPNIVSEQ